MLTDFVRLLGVAVSQGNTEAARMLADTLTWLIEPYRVEPFTETKMIGDDNV